MASGIAHRLFNANLTRICMTEIARPLAVRRAVAFSEAVYERRVEIEGVGASLIAEKADLEATWAQGRIAVIVDPSWAIIESLRPDVVIDAIMAKRNLGTAKHEASLVIGVGPGFAAPLDVHAVIESNRGHDLGRVIYSGTAEPHTGVPGFSGGYSTERVLRAPLDGPVRHVKSIGDAVKKGDVVLYVGQAPVCASIDGILRGLIREIPVKAGRKLGDVEPRGERSYCFTISDKARAIGGGVLEAVMTHAARGGGLHEHKAI
jgi:xanthine dehydrogenase accessory factor